MKVLIDGDSCSVIPEAEQISSQYGLPVIIYADIQRCIHAKQAKVVYVCTDRDAADKELIKNIKPGDIVITADYGLASIALLRQADCIHPHGFVYTDENIMGLLNHRHFLRRMWQKKGRKLRKYGPKMHCSFKNDFPRLIEKNLLKRRNLLRESE